MIQENKSVQSNNPRKSVIQTNIPQLRFPEFQGDWEKHNLGEIASFSKGKGISKADIVEYGATECIRYGELYTTYGETIDEVKSRTNIDDLVLSEANDVIIPASGETQIDIATASCVLRDGIALGGDLNIIKTENNGVFLSYYLNNKKKLEIASLAQGISVVHLYASQLSLLELNLPAKKEQDKIALFLRSTDQKLQALKKKHSLLEQYKKGVMQRLFEHGLNGLKDNTDIEGNQKSVKSVNPKNLRFRQKDGSYFPDWEVKKLGEVCEIKKGEQLNKEELTEIGSYPCLNGGVNFSGYTEKYNSNENTITISEGGNSCGYVNFMTSKFWLGGHCYKLVLTNEILTNYFFQLLKFNERKIMDLRVGSGLPNIQQKDLRSFEISISNSIEEQTLIANFLSALDEKINQTQTQIEKTEMWKKGLLQKMFC